MTSLKGKVAIITGASQGIGAAVAEKLAAEGVNLMLTARSQDKLNALAEKINKAGKGEAIYTPGDTTKPEDVDGVVHNTLANYGKVDILINNAGVATKVGLLQEVSIAEIDHVIDTNLKGAIYWMRAVLPSMIERHSGVIININSVAGKTAYPYWSIYDASKFGLTAITTAVREEQRQNNIKVIGIHPGAVDTPIWKSVDLDHEPDHAGMLDADDVANAVLYALQQPEKALIEEIVLTPTQPAL